MQLKVNTRYSKSDAFDYETKLERVNLDNERVSDVLDGKVFSPLSMDPACRMLMHSVIDIAVDVVQPLRDSIMALPVLFVGKR